MQICQDHWHELKNAIRQRGLWGLVSPNGYVANQTMKQMLDGRSTKAPFDPLIATSLLIAEQAQMALGEWVLTYHHCPLCEVDQGLGEGLSVDWIETDADSILRLCLEKDYLRSEN